MWEKGLQLIQYSNYHSFGLIKSPMLKKFCFASAIPLVAIISQSLERIVRLSWWTFSSIFISLMFYFFDAIEISRNRYRGWELSICWKVDLLSAVRAISLRRILDTVPINPCRSRTSNALSFWHTSFSWDAVVQTRRLARFVRLEQQMVWHVKLFPERASLFQLVEYLYKYLFSICVLSFLLQIL